MDNNALPNDEFPDDESDFGDDDTAGSEDGDLLPNDALPDDQLDFDDDDAASFEEGDPSYPCVGMSSEEIDKHVETLRASLVSEEKQEALQASLLSKQKKQVKLRARLWGSLPEEILWNILMRLPMVTQCRYRCVCRKWKMLFSTPPTQPLSQLQSRPPCTIVCDVAGLGECFFCHGVNNWFWFPKPLFCDDALAWALVGTDEGLLCYDSARRGAFWLLIYNPITGSSRVLRPNVSRGFALCFRSFIVDRKTKTFKVVMLTIAIFGQEKLVIFDSKTQEWETFQGGKEAFPSLPSSDVDDEWFVWKNIFYQRAGLSHTYLAFNLESRLWSAIDVDLPCNTQAKYHIGCGKDHMLLVQTDQMAEDPIRIYKLDNTMYSPDLSITKWEKVPVDVPVLMRPLIAEIEGCKSYRHDFVYFTMGDSNNWIMYSLATRKWSVMPNVGRRSTCPVGNDFEWFNWEPQMDVDVDLGDFDETESVLAAAADADNEEDFDIESFDGDHHDTDSGHSESDEDDDFDDGI